MYLRLTILRLRVSKVAFKLINIWLLITNIDLMKQSYNIFLTYANKSKIFTIFTDIETASYFFLSGGRSLLTNRGDREKPSSRRARTAKDDYRQRPSQRRKKNPLLHDGEGILSVTGYGLPVTGAAQMSAPMVLNDEPAAPNERNIKCKSGGKVPPECRMRSGDNRRIEEDHSFMRCMAKPPPEAIRKVRVSEAVRSICSMR